MKPALLLATAAALALGAASAHAQAPAGYKVVKEVALGGPERWDYVVYDAPSHRVYVAHSDRSLSARAVEGNTNDGEGRTGEDQGGEPGSQSPPCVRRARSRGGGGRRRPVPHAATLVMLPGRRE